MSLSSMADDDRCRSAWTRKLLWRLVQDGVADELQLRPSDRLDIVIGWTGATRVDLKDAIRRTKDNAVHGILEVDRTKLPPLADLAWRAAAISIWAQMMVKFAFLPLFDRGAGSTVLTVDGAVPFPAKDGDGLAVEKSNYLASCKQLFFDVEGMYIASSKRLIGRLPSWASCMSTSTTVSVSRGYVVRYMRENIARPVNSHMFSEHRTAALRALYAYLAASLDALGPNTHYDDIFEELYVVLGLASLQWLYAEEPEFFDGDRAWIVSALTAAPNWTK